MSFIQWALFDLHQVSFLWQLTLNQTPKISAVTPKPPDIRSMIQGKLSWEKTVLLISVKISLEILQKYMTMWRQLALEVAHANGDAVLNKIHIENVNISVICFIHKLSRAMEERVASTWEGCLGDNALKWENQLLRKANRMSCENSESSVIP